MMRIGDAALPALFANAGIPVISDARNEGPLAQTTPTDAASTAGKAARS